MRNIISPIQDIDWMCGLCLATMRKLRKGVAWHIMTEPEPDADVVHA